MKKTKKTSKCTKILVEDLHVGDQIVTHFVSSEDLERRALKTQKVEKIEMCESQWRTHIHINKSDCYDLRTFVWITV